MRFLTPNGAMLTKWVSRVWVIRPWRGGRATTRRSGHCQSWNWRVEELEQRVLLSTVDWTGGAGDGQWLTPGNWSGDAVPTLSENVVINTASPATITIASSGLSVASLTTASDDTLSFTGGSLTIDATSSLSGPLTMTGGSLEGGPISGEGSGVVVTVTGPTSISAGNLLVDAGTTLSLPELTSYSADDTEFVTDGTGSVLDLSALTTLSEQNGYVTLDALSGGEINLSGLATTSLTGGTFDETGHGTILDGSVTTLTDVGADLDGNDTLVANNWTSFIDGNLDITGGSYTLPNLTNINGSSLSASGSLTLPDLTSYQATDATFTADGAGSLLNLSALSTINEPTNDFVNLYAAEGGEINLSGLTSTSLTGGSITDETNGSIILNGNLTGLSGEYVQLDGTDTQVASGWTSFTDGSLYVSGGLYTLRNLTDINGSTVEVTGGTLSLPGVTSYSTSADGNIFEASGTGSILNLPAMTTVVQSGTSNGPLTIYTLGGGEINFSDALVWTGPFTFTAYAPPVATIDSSYSYQFQAIGTGTITYSATGLPSWAQLNSATGVLSGTPTAGGTAAITVTAKNSLSSATEDVSLVVDGPVTFNVAADGSLTVPNGDYVGGTTFNVGAGATVTIDSGTFTGGAVFNVGTGGLVNIEDNPMFSGTLSGSGSGTVQVGDGRFYIGAGGLTLDFTGSMFQWISGQMDAGNGNLTNLGTMTITSPVGFLNDGVLDNYGTIIQTGTANLELGTDGVLPATFDNEAGASYLLEGDGGLSEISDSGSVTGQTALINAGTISKTGGTGSSTIGPGVGPGYVSYVFGAIINTGTIEVDSGALYLEASIDQISGGMLTGGTWTAADGATLGLADLTTITNNQGGYLTLNGAGSTIAGIADLASDSGSFVVTGGADFTTAGGFANSGSLTVGAGSILTVAGAFTQTSTGTLNDQIGGTPASGLFGKVAVSGAAALAGDFDLTLVNSFSPSSGQTFDVMSFASATGGFSSFSGLSPNLTEELDATGLDIQYPATEAVDLAATSVTAPTTADVGQSITVNWQATDMSSQGTTGSWQDSVYISATPTITSSSTLLGTVPQSTALAAGASYSASLTAALPAALAPGYYYVLVQVDSLYQLPDPNRANNTLAATTGEIDIGLPALTLGTAYSDTFTAADQDHYYQISVPAGGSLNVSLQSSAASGAAALYISQGTLPTLYNYQQMAAIADQSNQTAVVPQVLTGGTYFILAHSVSGAAATAGFTITATQTAAVTVSAISPSSGGNAGNVTLEIDGNNFTASATASLTLASTTINDSTIDFVDASQMYATFNVTGATPGKYTVTVKQGAQSVTAPSLFKVVAASAQSLNVVLITPQYIRLGRTGSILITYTNESENDIVAPLLGISSTTPNVYFSTPDNPNDYVESAQLLAVASSGPAGILRPGQSGQLTLTLFDDDTTSSAQIPVQVTQLEAGQTINWAAQEAALQPPSVPSAAWNTVFGNLLDIVGSTTDSYDAALAQTATYLSGLGETTSQLSDVGALWSFLVSQADAEFPSTTLTSVVDASLATPGSLSLAIDRTFESSIEGRSTPGIFGLGWTTSWQNSLSVDASGDVTIDTGGSFSYFPAQANGTFLNTDAEYGTLTLFGGIYTFTQASGTQYVFLHNGFLNYEQDKNGNRITLGYNSQNQPITLTYSNPSDSSEPTEQLSLTYNAQGFISQVSDGTGDVWNYTYDAAGHLLSETAPGPTAAGLTTSYIYNTSSKPEKVNALLSITNPNGSQQNFTYDSKGRLSVSSANGGTNALTYTYPAEAEVQSADAAGDVTIVWFNSLCLPAREQDPLGGISTYDFDYTNNNLVSFTNAAGFTFQYTYDQSGNLTQTVNPLGQTLQFTYDSLGDLTSFTDADGNTTDYNYSSNGNLLNITYPDGTTASATYNPLGDPVQIVEQNGDAVGVQYNSKGQLAGESFADGASQTFLFDAHGNLTQAESFNSSDVGTGTTTLTYNAANELTGVTYPGALSLSFTYNAQGQRIQSVDQTGYTINYTYDALGRLSELTNGSGDMIVQYTYNSVGELTEKLNGNGTYTTYAYDAAGNLTSEINYASGTTVNSSFAYTYNLLNEMTGMTDASGNVMTYGYDAVGELTQVTQPGGTTITYVYNADGDRTEVLNNSTSTSYSSNDDNEITQDGSTTYTYDANGNLATVINPSGTSTYTYNDLNQLVSIASSDGAVTTFQYSPLGYLVGEDVNGTQTNFLVNPIGQSVVASYNGSDSLIADYNYGLGLVSQTGPSGAGYYDFDATGDTVGITGANGAYVNQYSYLPFGETTTISAALPNPFQYAGQAGVMTVAPGLDLMGARVYVVSTGQFASNDPLGLHGGDTNVRRYVQNQPTDFVDPFGTACLVAGPVEGGPDSFFGFSFGYSKGASAGISVGSSAGDFAGIGLGASVGVFAGISVGPSIGIGTTSPGATVANVGVDTGASLSLGAGASVGASVGIGLGASAGASAGASFGYSNGSTYGFAFGVGWGGGCTPPPPPPPPAPGSSPGTPGSPGPTGDTSPIMPNDPNALVGPDGYGAQGFISATGTLPYTVDFENDGTAAAQDVTVTEQLDPSLDWSTFQLGSFGFGPVNITIPAGLTQYQTNVSYQNSDGSSLNVQVALDFNVQTGLLTVTYTSLDPLTGQAPSGVFDGFLYPESQSAVNSDGFVQYTVGLNAGLTTGTAIHQQASVVFDTNAPLDTAPADNTIDASVPKSTVAALPAVQNSSSFPVTWSGHDNAEGSGVAFYDVYVSDNGGAFTPFLTGATATSATYYGFPGHTYGFYSLATSNVGTVQATPSAAQATTAVAADASAPFAVLASGVLTVNGTAGNDTIALTTSGSNLIATLDGASSPPFAISSITSINVNGNAGADLITLGAGVPGSSVQGGPGADTIFGGSGADTLGGGKGKDSITAGSGNDLIHGGAGADTIVGGTGDETLFGGLGADVITGGSGDDQINGGAGTNQMHAGTGTDAFYAENGTADQIFAGSATNDTLFYSASDNYVIESGAIPPGNITLVS